MNFLKEVVIGDHYLKNDVVEFHVRSEGAVQLDSPSFKSVILIAFLTLMIELVLFNAESQDFFSNRTSCMHTFISTLTHNLKSL